MTASPRRERFETMTELLRELPAEENYAVQVDASHRSRVKLFAPHAGCIEPCTGPIVLALAAGKFDSFLFHGLRRKDCFATLHVSSVRYDEPSCLSLAREAAVALAVHGCGGTEAFVEVGGGNVLLKGELTAHLRGLGYDVRLPDGRRAGESRENFVNLAKEMGIQIEMSEGFRRMLFPHFPKAVPAHPASFIPFIEGLRAWLGSLEAKLAAAEAAAS